MPVNHVQVLQFCLLLFALPAQYMLTEWWGSESEVSRTKSVYMMLQNVQQFRANYLSLDSWKSWLKRGLENLSKGLIFTFERKLTSARNPRPTDRGECVAKEVFVYNQPMGYFSSSVVPRSPRLKKIKYRVGQVIKHKKYGYRGVIVGWDDKCKAPTEWIAMMHGENVPIVKQPHYSVLVDKRDRGDNEETYVAEENIIVQSNTEIQHKNVWDYFDFYDGAQYHMRPAMQELYPYD